ncbi:MAG: hypothetical protein ACK5NF_06315, partial [Bacilli bacterium]
AWLALKGGRAVSTAKEMKGVSRVVKTTSKFGKAISGKAPWLEKVGTKVKSGFSFSHKRRYNKSDLGQMKFSQLKGKNHLGKRHNTVMKKTKNIGFDSSKKSVVKSIFKNLGILGSSEKAISQFFHGDYKESARTVGVQVADDKRISLIDKIESKMSNKSISEDDLNDILEETGYDIDEIEEITGIHISPFIESGV